MKLSVKKTAIRILVAAAITAAMAGATSIGTGSAEAVVRDTGCASYKPGIYAVGTFYHCYREGELIINGYRAYAWGFDNKQCSSVGCTLQAGGQYWYWYLDSTNHYQPWYCDSFNGAFWLRVSCTF